MKMAGKASWFEGESDAPLLSIVRFLAAETESSDEWAAAKSRVFLVFFLDNADWRCENGIGIRFPMTLSASLAARAEVSRLMRPLFSLTNDRSPIKEAAR